MLTDNIGKAIEAYATDLENSADSLDRIANACEAGRYVEGLSATDKLEAIAALRLNAARNRAAAQVNRLP